MKRTEPTVPVPPATNVEPVAVDHVAGNAEAERGSLSDTDAEQEVWQVSMEGCVSDVEDDRLLGELAEAGHQAKQDPEGLLQCGAPASGHSVFEIAAGVASQSGAGAEVAYAA